MDAKTFVMSTGKVVKMRGLTFGEACRVIDEATEFDVKTMIPKIKSEKNRIKRLTLMIVEPKMTEDAIASLSEPEAAELERFAREVNELPLPQSPQPSSPTVDSKSPSGNSSES